MAKKKLGSVKKVREVIVDDVDLENDVTGVLPAVNGGTGLSDPSTAGNVLTSDGAGGWVSSPAGAAVGLAYGIWGAPGAEAGDAIEIELQLYDAADDELVTATAEVEIMVSDGTTDGEPSNTAIIAAAGTPIGVILAGTGTATVYARCSAAGIIAVKVTEAAVGSRYLWFRQGPNSRHWIRAEEAPKQLTFA